MAREFDPSKYASPTGRVPSKPEMQDLVHGRVAHRGPDTIMQTDFSAIEMRVLASMARPMISYAHKAAPQGQRFRQFADDKVPGWAVDVQPEIDEVTEHQSFEDWARENGFA